MRKKIKIISLDTSTTCSGVAIFNGTKYHSSTALVNDKKLKGDEKLDSMIKLIISFLDKEKPDVCVTEKLAMTRNAQTVSMLNELLGAVRGYCVTNGIDYCSLRPSEWRKVAIEITGQKPNGRKREDQKAWALDMVNNKLNILTDSDDEAESVLLGYSYINMFNE